MIAKTFAPENGVILFVITEIAARMAPIWNPGRAVRIL